jgi:hypothetical protein
MTIKLTCKNGHSFEKTEEQLIELAQACRYCYCGEKLSVQNLDEIVSEDMKQQYKYVVQ